MQYYIYTTFAKTLFQLHSCHFFVHRILWANLSKFPSIKNLPAKFPFLPKHSNCITAFWFLVFCVSFLLVLWLSFVSSSVTLVSCVSSSCSSYFLVSSFLVLLFPLSLPLVRLVSCVFSLFLLIPLASQVPMHNFLPAPLAACVTSFLLLLLPM